MRISRKLAAVAAFFVVGGAVAGCGSSIPGNSVATVAGNPITLPAYNHWMYIAAKGQAAQAAQQGVQEPVIVSNNPNDFTTCVKAIRIGIASLKSAPEATLKNDCKSVFTQYNNEIMTYLIEGYWLQAQANKLGITLTDAKLNSGFAKYLKTTYPNKTALATVEKESGQTREDLLFQYRIQTLYMKMLKKYEKPVTKAAIASYYAAHKAAFGTPESRDLHLVRTKTAAQAQAALHALKSGQSWNTVAKTYSVDAAAKANGGLLSGVTAGEEETAASHAIFGAAVNQLVGPVKGIFGYYVIQVTKITPAVQESLASASKTIKTTLTQTAQTAAQTKVLKLAKSNFLKQTTCRSAYQVQSVCSNYKAPKTTTSTVPKITTPANAPTSTNTTSTSSSTGTKTATTATKTSTTKKK